MTKAGLLTMKWSAADPYVLTTSYVLSDAEIIDFAKRTTIFPEYKGGTGSSGNVLSWEVWLNPLNATQDPNGLYWSQYGIYVDAGGTWTGEPAQYTLAQGAAGTYVAGQPLKIDQLDAQQIAIKVKETVNAGAAGSVHFYVVPNMIL